MDQRAARERIVAAAAERKRLAEDCVSPEELLSREDLTKAFSSDQPRDAHGRWAEGEGATEVSKVVTAAHEELSNHMSAFEDAQSEMDDVASSLDSHEKELIDEKTGEQLQYDDPKDQADWENQLDEYYDEAGSKAVAAKQKLEALIAAAQKHLALINAVIETHTNEILPGQEHVPAAKVAKGYSDPEQIITVSLRGDDNDCLEKLVRTIGSTAEVGHSFSVVVDPGDSDYEKRFGFDGDGAFRILSVESSQVKKADTVSTATGIVSYDQTSATRRKIMPWKTNEDLPAGVRGVLPGEAQDVFRSVANRIMEDGASDKSAIRQAWTAVKNGWKKTGGGEWVRKAFNPDQPRDDHGRFGSGGSDTGARGGKFSEDQKAMHGVLTQRGWVPASSDDFKNNPAASKESGRHEATPARNGVPSHGGYDSGAQTYVHPDRPGEAIGTGSHPPSHGSNWSHTATLSGGPKVGDFQFLGGTHGRTGTGPGSLTDHLNSVGSSPLKLMAKGATIMNAQTSFFMPITKKESQQDGSVIVTGYASTPTKDLDDEVISLDAVKKALPAYMEWRNVRAMHQPVAVGTAKEAHIDDAGLFLRARIVEPGAVRLVNEGVYQGFSIGGRKLAKQGNTVTDLELVEISIVDRPCNPDTRFAIAKGAKVINSKRIDLIAACDPVPDKIELERSEIGLLGKLMMKLGGIAKTAHDIMPTAGNRPMPSAAPQEGEGMDVDKREVSDKERESLADQGHAMPDGSFPIKNEGDLTNAVQAHGRAKNPASAKRHIVRQAKRLGATHLLPEDWAGSTKGEKLAKSADLYTVSQMIELLGRLEYLEECCEGEDDTGSCCVPVGIGTKIDCSKEFTDKFGALLTQFGDMTAELLDMAISQMKDEEAEEAAGDLNKAWSDAAREAAAAARQANGKNTTGDKDKINQARQARVSEGNSHFSEGDHVQPMDQEHRAGTITGTRFDTSTGVFHHEITSDNGSKSWHHEDGIESTRDKVAKTSDIFDDLSRIAKGAEAAPQAADPTDVFADLKSSFELT